jgi:hypothetical protein
MSKLSLKKLISSGKGNANVFLFAVTNPLLQYHASVDINVSVDYNVSVDCKSKLNNLIHTMKLKRDIIIIVADNKSAITGSIISYSLVHSGIKCGI